MIKICKWKYNKDSPVMLMIDDLCNAWVDINKNGKLDREGDFGSGMMGENSSFRFLEEEILKDFPYVRVNFYVPVGKRIGIVSKSNIEMHSAPINENEKIASFFRKIHENPKYELSYHGLTHGKAFEDPKKQLQEWETYKSLDEALEKIDEGKNIFKEVTGEFPKGGKYCGYTGSKYGDKSIDKSNFFWWHRYYNKGLDLISDDVIVGKDRNKITAFDIKEFGKNKVIDIPTTLSGGLFTNYSKNYIKRLGKILLKHFVEKRKEEEIEFLLKNNLVISIQEHISPGRNDGKRQHPNIYDDKKSLIKILNFLKNKNVWYCTGTELAKYCYLRKILQFKKTKDTFEIISKKDDKNIYNKELTIMLDKKYKGIIYPNGNRKKVKNNVITIKILQGEYKLF